MESTVYQRIGQRIRLARESARMSQEDLAQRLGYRSPTAISYFETRLRKVSIYDLQRIAEILSRPLDYFVGELAAPVETPLVQLRALAVEPSARQTLDTFVQFVATQTRAQLVEIPARERRSPEEAATYVLRQVQITRPPVPALQVAGGLGIPVFEWDFPDEISGAFVCHEGAAAIAVNQSHPGHRQRFTIAHELGHFVLAAERGLFVDLLSREHMPSLGPTDGHEEEERRLEMAANWFASDLLMPAEWIRRDVREHGTNLAYLSRRYDVSQQALWYRLLSLRLVQREEAQPSA